MVFCTLMKIFCSGIGGIGLSAYAAQMNARGHIVSGSDRSFSVLTEDLQKQGMTVTTNQDGSAIEKGIDLFVYSEAIPETSPERVKAKELGIRQISYFQALGELTKGTNLIAICGSHGKSSTTAMIVKIFLDGGLDPNVVLGTKMKELRNRNWRKGTGNLWVVEACEYRRSFLYLSPETMVITTTDGDHFDAFKDQADYESAFVEFAQKLPPDGKVIGHGKDARVQNIVKSAARTFIDADKENEPKLSVPGNHMRENARLAMTTAQFWLDDAVIASSLKGFMGTWRRMEIKGTSKEGALVIDDYGHHPVEIAATLQAMREGFPNKRIVCVFQPHTHHRTLSLWNEFASAFSDADVLILSDVYDARPDTEEGRVEMTTLQEAIHKGSNVTTLLGGDLTSTEAKARRNIKKDDVLLIMGAGTITELATTLVS